MAISKATLLATLKSARKEQDSRNEAKYVKQVTGKALSTNDYSNDEKTKLAGIEATAQVNVLEKVSVNGTVLTATDKGVNIDLADYAKTTDVESKIKTAVTAVLVYKGTVESFSALPTDATKGDVYNITAAGGTDANGTVIKAGDNVAYNGTGWDDLGGTTDLSNLVVKEDGKALLADTDKAKYDALVANSDEQVSDTDIATIFAD